MKIFHINKKSDSLLALIVTFLIVTSASTVLSVDYRHVTASISPPALDCPDNIVVNNDPGLCSAKVVYTPPEGATQVSGLPSGSDFPVGVTTNTFELGSESCSFTVTVNDTEAPVFLCGDDITVSAINTLCQTVDYEEPTATDNCDGVITPVRIAGPASGSIFPVGVTTVTYQATDSEGNVSTCSFNIIVAGTSIPTLQYDGSISQLMAPQGGLPYQRVFYLITADEMVESGLEAGTVINSIGFILGKPQSTLTKGNLQVWLQNTTDTESRYDNEWTVLSNVSNNYLLDELPAGDYEWQVRPVCDGEPLWTDPQTFSTSNPYACGDPYNANNTSITASSATITWEAYTPDDFSHFELLYNVEPFDDDWTSIPTLTESSYSFTGLDAEKHIEWKVRSFCGVKPTEWLSSSFVTESTDNCPEPSGLTATPNGDNTADLAWAAVSGDNPYYTVAYRRKGTSTWSNIPTMTNSLKLYSLESGTTYEWRVRTNCTVSSEDYVGSFVDGNEFTLSGNTACYELEKATTKEISENSAVLSWIELPGITNYEIRYRLKESITWENAITPSGIDPMTKVSDDEIIIPAEQGKLDFIFSNGNAFTYSGGGIYVALQYSLSEGDISSISNTALCTRQNSWIYNEQQQTNDHHLLGFNGFSHPESEAFPDVLRSNDNRPETWFGSSAYVDKTEVSVIYTMGEAALPFSGSVPISALIRNYTTGDTELPVTLEIKNSDGQVVNTETVTQSISAGCAEVVSFNNWSPDLVRIYQIKISVPDQAGENVIENNFKLRQIAISGTHTSYADTSASISSVGTSTEGGLILCKYKMTGCGKVISADIFLDITGIDRSVAAVVLNEDGEILATSSYFTILKDEANAWHSFFFQNPPSFTDQDYYIGLIQPAFTEEYHAVGIQWEGTILRENVYFKANLDGTGIVSLDTPGQLMIKAGLMPISPVPIIQGGEVLCAGTEKTLTAGSKTIRYASEVLSFSSELSGPYVGAEEALGSPDVWPETSSGSSVWINKVQDSESEFIELQFPEPGPVNYIDIYETFGSGAIDKVYVYNADIPELVYPPLLEQSSTEANLLHIDFTLTSFDVSKIKIVYNTSLFPGCHALDAVAIGELQNNSEFTSYSWSTGESTSSIEVNLPDAYSLTVTTESGCLWTESIEVETPVISQPVITASGPTEFCDGGNVILTCDRDENIVWSNDETTKSITVNESGSYTVSYDNGCESSLSAAMPVTVYELPIPAISGGAICAGSSTTLTGESGFESYQWSTMATSQSISVTLPGYYYLTVTDGNGCEGASYVTAYNAPVPIPQITGDPYYCHGEVAALNAGDTYSSYLWSTGSTDYGITVSEPSTVTLTVTNEYGCSGSDEVTTGEYPIPQPFISGTLSLCAGSSTRLDAGEGYASYLWSTDETTSAITVSGQGVFSVTVTDFNGCTGSASAETTEDGVLPGTPGEITGPLFGLCNATSLEYSIEPVSNTEYYVWDVPENVTILSGQGTTNIMVNASQPVTGLIKVAAANKCGKSQSWNGRAIILNGTPAIPSLIAGQTAGICGSIRQYTIDPVFGATSYTWNVPQNAQIVSGQGSNEIWVNFDENFTTGEICVYSQNDCGISQSKCLTITGMPEQPSIISGPGNVCKKQKNVIYSIDPVVGSASYQWSVPMQATIIAGQGSTSIVVTFGTKSGNISVKAVNSCGQSQMRELYVDVTNCRGSDTYTFIIDPENGGSNIKDPEWNYAWGEQIYEPEVIASAGGSNLVDGILMSWTIGEPITSTIDNDSYMLTQGFHQGYFTIIETSKIELGNISISIYPVPARDYINIRVVSQNYPVDILLEMYDMIGNRLFTDRTNFNFYNHVIPLVNYPVGMMILKVTDVNNHHYGSYKIIKVR